MFAAEYEPLPKRVKPVRVYNSDAVNSDAVDWRNYVYATLITPAADLQGKTLSPPPMRMFRKRNCISQDSVVMPSSPISAIDLSEPIKRTKRSMSLNSMVDYNYATSDIANKEIEIEETEIDDTEHYAEDAAHAGYAPNGFMVNLFRTPVKQIDAVLEHISQDPARSSNEVNHLAIKLFNVQISKDCAAAHALACADKFNKKTT